MAETSFPWENIDTTETQYSQLFRTLNNGVNGTPDGDEVKVVAGFAGLTVDVEPGQAMVQGHFYINTLAKTLTLATADSTNDRIDTIVLELDDVANEIVAKVVTGTPAASPVPPTLTQTEPYGVFEFPLADVLVEANAGTPTTITDRRAFMGEKFGTWTTANRPDPGTRTPIGYNTTIDAVEFYDGTGWRLVGPNVLDDIPDVSISTPLYGQVLSYDPAGNEWANNPDNMPVMVFDDATARGSAIPSPTEGMVTYLKDQDKIQQYTTDWEDVGRQGVGPNTVQTVRSNIFSQSLAAGSETSNVFEATITPSTATSKILVIVHAVANPSGSTSITGDTAASLTIYRGSTAIGIGDTAGSRRRVTAIGAGVFSRTAGGTTSMTLLDNPGTTSAVTYGVRLSHNSNITRTVVLNRTGEDSNNDSYSRSVSSITLMEVAA